MCCTSLRGAAYFGASIHITLGAVLFIRYVIVTAFLTLFSVTDVIKDRITGYLLPFVAYITLFLAFGIVIFHSVEKEYFIILKWATLGFSLLQLLVLVTLFVLRFLPAYSYPQFPFLPISITDGYVHTPFQTPEGGGDPSTSPDHLSDEVYSSSELLQKVTRSADPPPYPTSATAGGSSSRHFGSDKGPSSEEISVLEVEPPPTPPPNKWLGELYSLIGLIVTSIVSLVYFLLLFLYVRQLIYEDSGHVFGHAQSVTRNVAFYVQPQFAQSGNSDNKLTNSPSPAMRTKAGNDLQNCTQPMSNTQIPSEFLPQPQYAQRHQVGNHLKPEPNPSPLHKGPTPTPNQPHPRQPPTSLSHQGQNHLPQRSPVPPAREMQQNIQNQTQQQVITIYPQKGGGYTSSSSSPRMQVKFAKPLEQHLAPSNALAQSHIHSGEPSEPPRSCLVNSSANASPSQSNNHQPPTSSSSSTSAHMMPPPLPQRLESSGRSPMPPYQEGGQHYPPPQQHQQQQQMPPPHRGYPGPPPPIPPPHQHIQGQGARPASPFTHQHNHPHPHQQQQHNPYHGKGRAQQLNYSDMVDNSSYLVFSGNPNTSNHAPPPQQQQQQQSLHSPAPHQPHQPHLASNTHNTYPYCSQRRPSGSMV